MPPRPKVVKPVAEDTDDDIYDEADIDVAPVVPEEDDEETDDEETDEEDAEDTSDDDDFGDEEEQPEQVVAAEKTKARPKKPAKRVIKYMGGADVNYLAPDENILGTVPDDALPGERLVWHASGGHWTAPDGEIHTVRPGHLLHTEDHPNVPSAFWGYLVKLNSYQDVTSEHNSEDKKVPKNTYDITWRLKNDHTGGI